MFYKGQCLDEKLNHFEHQKMSSVFWGVRGSLCVKNGYFPLKPSEIKKKKDFHGINKNLRILS
ncbi:hypothetical protein HMPREF1409_01740 [Helicobacter pylori GAM246Ai]|nr:hypothetical protein HMPREF1409_01740 [Helicobacter pylori GAM246Ai]